MTQLMKVYTRGYKLNPDDVDKGLRAGLEKLGGIVKGTYEEIVSEWANKPEFEVWGPGKRGDHITVAVGPKPDTGPGGVGEVAGPTQIFVWVDQGTTTSPKNPITRKGGGVFPIQKYDPRTRPGAVAQGGSGRRYGPVYYRRSFMHRGVDARNFTGGIAKLLDTDRRGGVRDVVQEALNAIIRFSAARSRTKVVK